MTRDLLGAGGPLGVRKTGPKEYQLSIPLPKDDKGRLARECPDSSCSPGYFKVTPGTGITVDHHMAFCPYCRTPEDPKRFASKEQVRYAQDMVRREAEKAAGELLREAMGFGPAGAKVTGGGMLSIEMTMAQRPPRPVRRPFEEDLLHTLTCPFCGLDHEVFGLATWCPDCGADVFMEHVRSEYDVVRAMLGDGDRRAETLGPRVAARDLENCLEDVVTIFEAVLKAMLVRHLRSTGEQEDSIQEILKRRIRNTLQNPKRAREVVQERLGADLFGGLSAEDVEQVVATFEKRHPITHNLGIVDRKYIEAAYEAEREGREVRVSRGEIAQAIDTCWNVLTTVHSKRFVQTETDQPPPDETASVPQE